MISTTIMQGDEYDKPLNITINGESATASDIDDIEVVVANCRKTLSNGDIYYSSQNQSWMLHLSQEDTLSMHEGLQRFQVRVKLTEGDVIGRSLAEVKIIPSQSKEIL